MLIVLLLALAFGSSRHVLLVLLALPSTLIGGVVAVAITGGTLTLGAMVGFVALFGMAARNTILLISHYDHLVGEEGQPWSLETSMRGAEERLTPVLLTALLTALGAAAGGAAAASTGTRDRGSDGGRYTRRAGILYTGEPAADSAAGGALAAAMNHLSQPERI